MPKPQGGNADMSLQHLAIFHDQDPVTVENRVQAVGNGQHGAAFEGILDGALDECVRLGVH